MGDNSQIPVVGRGSIKIQHGAFKNVLYVPSLATNLLYVYQMTHTGSPNQVVFSPKSMEISGVSTQNIIPKGVANHASKAYEFSQFLPYSDRMQSHLPLEREGKFVLLKPFAYDNVSDSESEAEDQPFMELKMKFSRIHIQIQSLLPILGLNEHKRLLRKLRT